MAHPEVLITAACRTPIGRAGGALAAVRPDDLAAVVLGEAARRAALPLDALDDVLLGCAGQAGEDGRN
ncbi:MAG TPA: acetyl-CoA C-acyltransferase, partial [Gemmatimonadales bacterium]|nr:acetyl-CoA C-acyltransferase [Gemmatimonadales bacterium]